MIVFGVAEVTTGVTHRFFGVAIANGSASGYAGAGLGALYAMAGILMVPMKRWGAKIAIALLILLIAGRILMVATGLFPLDSAKQALAIILGTLIAIIFTMYIRSKLSSFR